MRKIITNIRNTFRSSLTQGTSPSGLAVSTTLALVMGVFPVLGITTWVLTFAALRFRLNLALMIAVSYLAWPLQIFLIIPFLRLGEWIWQVPAFPLSAEKLQAAWEAGFFVALENFWQANLCAAGGWIAVSLPAGILLYFLLLPLFQYLTGVFSADTVEA